LYFDSWLSTAQLCLYLPSRVFCRQSFLPEHWHMAKAGQKENSFLWIQWVEYFAVSQITYPVCLEVHAIRWTLNLGKHHGMFLIKAPVSNFRVSVCVHVSFSGRTTPGYCWCLLNVKEYCIVKRTLLELYCAYFSAEVIVKLTRRLRERFVMFIEISICLIECIPGHTVYF